MDRPTVKDLDIVLMGGYPPEYEQRQGTATDVDITSCPANVWRVVINASCGGTSGCRGTLGVVRNGIYYRLNSGTAINGYSAILINPVILRPGDILHGFDPAGGFPFGSCQYVDVPIPSGGEGEFYRTRRA